MDLLSGDSALSLNDNESRIYARNYDCPPTCFYAGSNVVTSMLSGGCEIEGEIINSIVSSECKISAGAVVKNSILFPGTVVGKNATVNYAILGENSRVAEGASVGENVAKEDLCKRKITVLGGGYMLKSGEKVAPGEMREAQK